MNEEDQIAISLLNLDPINNGTNPQRYVTRYSNPFFQNVHAEQFPNAVPNQHINNQNLQVAVGQPFGDQQQHNLMYQFTPNETTTNLQHGNQIQQNNQYRYLHENQRNQLEFHYNAHYMNRRNIQEFVESHLTNPSQSVDRSLPNPHIILDQRQADFVTSLTGSQQHAFAQVFLQPLPSQYFGKFYKNYRRSITNEPFVEASVKHFLGDELFQAIQSDVETHPNLRIYGKFPPKDIFLAYFENILNGFHCRTCEGVTSIPRSSQKQVFDEIEKKVLFPWANAQLLVSEEEMSFDRKFYRLNNEEFANFVVQEHPNPGANQISEDALGHVLFDGIHIASSIKNEEFSGKTCFSHKLHRKAICFMVG